MKEAMMKLELSRSYSDMKTTQENSKTPTLSSTAPHRIKFFLPSLRMSRPDTGENMQAIRAYILAAGHLNNNPIWSSDIPRALAS